jgi:hypothetical protein
MRWIWREDPERFDVETWTVFRVRDQPMNLHAAEPQLLTKSITISPTKNSHLISDA